LFHPVAAEIDSRFLNKNRFQSKQGKNKTTGEFPLAELLGCFQILKNLPKGKSGPRKEGFRKAFSPTGLHTSA
jgi:hypothetical protein